MKLGWGWGQQQRQARGGDKCTLKMKNGHGKKDIGDDNKVCHHQPQQVHHHDLRGGGLWVGAGVDHGGGDRTALRLTVHPRGPGEGRPQRKFVPIVAKRYNIKNPTPAPQRTPNPHAYRLVPAYFTVWASWSLLRRIVSTPHLMCPRRDYTENAATHHARRR